MLSVAYRTIEIFPFAPNVMDFRRLAPGLALTVGKTISRVFLVQRGAHMHHIYLCFDDGSHYELFGNGLLSGLRGPDQMGAATVRRLLERDLGSDGFRYCELPRVPILRA